HDDPPAPIGSFRSSPRTQDVDRVALDGAPQGHDVVAHVPGIDPGNDGALRCGVEPDPHRAFLRFVLVAPRVVEADETVMRYGGEGERRGGLVVDVVHRDLKHIRAGPFSGAGKEWNDAHGLTRVLLGGRIRRQGSNLSGLTRRAGSVISRVTWMSSRNVRSWLTTTS